MRTLPLLAVAVLASACGSSGYVKAQLTDAPLESIGAKQVLVTVGDVRVHNQGDNGTPTNGNPDVGAEQDGSNTTGWIVLCNKPQVFDLMALRNGVKADLCSGQSTEMITGMITKIRLGVTAAKIVFNDGTEAELKVPSGPQSGWKLNVGRELDKNETMNLLIDFDAEQSIHAEGNGKYTLRPVLRLK